MNTDVKLKTEWAIETNGLSRIFGKFKALDNVDFKVATGNIYGLLGHNGAGKTTLIRVLTTLLSPSSGTASIFGHDISAAPHQVRRLIGVTGQYASIDENLTGKENLYLFGCLNGLSRKGAKSRANQLLEAFSLTEVAHKKIQNYSGGMRRRLDLAVSLISNPPLIFLDEPTTGLDPRSRIEIWQIIRDLVNQGSTVVLTTQYLEEADRLASRIGVLDHGRLIAEGSPDQLKEKVGNSRLIITLQNSEELNRSLALLASTYSKIGTKHEQNQLNLPLVNSSLATDILLKLRNANIEPQTISVDKPDLDEVFLALTEDQSEIIQETK